MDNRKKNETSKRQLPNKTKLIIHIVIGGYLVYLAHSIFNNMDGTQGAVTIIFPVLFCIVGAALIFSSLRSLKRGEYEGGPADPEKEDEEMMEEEPTNEDKEDGEL